MTLASTLPLLLLCVSWAVVSPVSADSASILSAIYGYAECIGVSSTSNLTELAQHHCAFTANGETSAVAASTLKILCPKAPAMMYNDGMPINFGAQIDSNELSAVAASALFAVKLNDGTMGEVNCATLTPANEGNECRTVLLIGKFGNGRTGTVRPVKVSVIGSLTGTLTNGTKVNLNGASLDLSSDVDVDYNNAALRMVWAQLTPFSTSGEATLPMRLINKAYPNHCGQVFGKNVTHRIQVALNGGGTLDGVTSITPGNSSSLFQVFLRDGTRLNGSSLLGVADLGQTLSASSSGYKADGDNYFDICLNVPSATAKLVAHVRMPCAEISLVPPKGFPACKDHTFPVDNLAAF